ncbi:MAG: PAS domain-containing sensor histidine kinase [bacterium]
MQKLPSSIDDLLTAAHVVQSDVIDAHSACELLEVYRPSLLMLVHENGDLVFLDDFDSGIELETARSTASDLVTRLAVQQECRLDVITEVGLRWAYAIRLSSCTQVDIAACLLRPSRLLEEGSNGLEASGIVCAAFGWAAGRKKSLDTELQTRVRHLQAEHEALKHAQNRAVAAAIEEREKRLEQQRQDMAQLEAMMKLAADGIVTVNEEGIVQSFNDAASEIFGYAPKEVVGQGVSILAPASGCCSDHEPLVTCFTSDAMHVTGQRREVLGKRKDNSLFPLEIAISKVPLCSGCVFIGIFRDIAERRRLERQVLQAQKMESVGQLAAGIAHEINTPTQFVGDNSRFLEDAFQDLKPLLKNCNQLCGTRFDGGTSEQVVKDLKAMAQSADLDYLLEEIPLAIRQSLEGVERVATIVRSMKDFSHPGNETKQAVDLNRTLESTLTVCRNEWKYVADIVTDFDADLSPVNCLQGECNQVFLNLIMNAAHAIGDTLTDTSKQKGTITVATRRKGDWAEIRIKDTGTGIPEKSRSRIFDPFFTTKEVGRGTGQGLAIAHAVVTEKHKGTISFETEIGKGTTFIVRLPISGD